MLHLETSNWITNDPLDIRPPEVTRLISEMLFYQTQKLKTEWQFYRIQAIRHQGPNTLGGLELVHPDYPFSNQMYFQGFFYGSQPLAAVVSPP